MRPWELHLPVLVALIAVVGLVTLASAAPESSYVVRQATWFAVGLGAATLLVVFGGRFLDRVSVPLYVGSVFALALVLLVGEEVNGARRWLDLGPLRFQPSELAKLALILVLGWFLPTATARRPVGYAVVAILVGVPFMLVLLGPDLGSALVLAAIGLGMLFVRGVPRRLVLVTMLLAALAVPAVLPNLAPHQQARIISFLDPGADPQGAGYQVTQARIAVGSGGLTGKGWGQGTQNQHNFIPFKHTDFIFPVLAEEFGFVGSVALLALFGLAFWRLFAMALECPRPRDQLVIVGVLAYFAFQTVVNLGVALGLAPVTGLTLPIVSYGGTNLVVTMVVLGLAMLVHRERYRVLA